MEGVRAIVDRDAKLQDALTAAQEERAKAEADKQSEWDQMSADMQKAIDDAKAAFAEQKRVADGAQTKIKSLSMALKDEKTSRAKADAELEKANAALEQVRKEAEEAIAAATKKAEEAAVTAVAAYKDSEECWLDLYSSYDQGLYHMARCHGRALERGQPPSVQDLADFTQEYNFAEDLLPFHATMPFADAEVEATNAGLRRQGLPEMQLPPVVVPNMRTLQQEREAQAKAAKEAAEREAAAAEASERTGDGAPQTEATAT